MTLSRWRRSFHPRPIHVAVTRTKTFTRHPPRFHEPGGGALANEQHRRSPLDEACPERARNRHRALCWHTHARGSLTQARSARAPHVAVPLRSRLESPRSAITRRTEARRRSKRFRLADPTSASRERDTKTRSAGPRTLRSRAPPAAFASVPGCYQLFTGGRSRTKHHRGSSLSRVTPARSARLEGRAAHASRPSKGLGITSLGCSAKSDRDRRYPRCFPSLAACLTIRAYAQSRPAGRILSTASHQPVEKRGAFFDLRLVRRP